MAVKDHRANDREDCGRELTAAVRRHTLVTSTSTSTSPDSSNYATPSSSVDASPHRHAHVSALTIRHQSYSFALPVPRDQYILASEIRDQFIHSISAISSTTNQHEPYTSLLELIADFLDFNAKSIPGWAGAERSSRQKLLRVFLDHLEREFITDDIHAIAVRSTDDHQKLVMIIGSYYSACNVTSRPISPRRSALLNSVAYDEAKLFAVLGGQGITSGCLDELRDIFTVYHTYLADYMAALSDVLKSLASTADISECYQNGLDIINWLQDPGTTPEVGYLTSAPVSFPLIGVLQLANYVVTLKVLGQSPANFRQHLSGIAGHSQGVVIATVIAASDSWASFMSLSRKAIEVLFWIGALSQQVCPEISLDPKIVSDSISHDEGVPSSMLSVRDISEAQMQEHIEATNKYLPSDRIISIALRNGPRNFVIAGPALSLYGFNVRLRQFKVSPDTDQTRIPFKQRKLAVTNRFLSITAPFHSNYLAPAAELLTQRLNHIVIPSNSLYIPVYDTDTGKDLSTLRSGNVVPWLVRMITISPVNWERASTFELATHILDFGPGNSSSIGVVTSRNKEGTGVRVILANTLTGRSTHVGYKSELFTRSRDSVIFSESWVQRHGPRLCRTSDGQIQIDTKMSRLLHMPPIMVAGMTPTTVSWKFVSATINAGYHVELAGGGYFSSSAMTNALQNITASIPSGRGLTINLIYVNARAMAWQIPLLQKLSTEGVPIDGLTIGAGVPSIDVAQKYIDDLGLKHIAFKPSSSATIKLVIGIAKANPKFPVILQWTGGRAGGHHSFEDFHAPILQTYSQIRDCDNIILVAGSGFGGSIDFYPYLTGEWSTYYGYPPMPYDGVLFGSRMMTAKEAPTSLEAKRAIVEAKGLSDSHWEKTYGGAAGGVITVISEMGEPIHVLATRGMRFWAEMDKIFKMPKEQRLAELEKSHRYIIKKLNDDYHKVWFGKNTAGEAVELKDMTYNEVLFRMVELMYINSERRWIDESLQKLTGDFIRRVEERFAGSVDNVSVLQDYSELDDPHPTLDVIIGKYPDVKDHLIAPLDVQFLLSLCLRPGQKPVPFVPVLDENFEFYFKKDSLWQSENLWAVVGNDVDRTQILQGPVAAQHTVTLDEPVQDILDNVKNDLISFIVRDHYGAKITNVPNLVCPGEVTAKAWWPAFEDNISITETSESIVYEISTSHEEVPATSSWFKAIAGEDYTWRHALFSSESVISGAKRLPNPIRRLCAPSVGLRVTIIDHNDLANAVIIIGISSKSNHTYTVIKARLQEKDKILVECIFNNTLIHDQSTLKLVFSYHPEERFAPIREVLDGRLDEVTRFYRRIWFGDEQLDLDAPLTQQFTGEELTITREAVIDFVRAIGDDREAYVNHPDKTLFAPLDFGIVVAWKALLKPIFLRTIGGNILNLVHLSNKFELVSGASPLKAGDTVTTSSRLTAVRIQDAGKVVEVHAVIARDEVPVMEVTSQFMYRGRYTDFETTFERKVEKPMRVHLKSEKDVQILKSKSWFRLSSPDTILLGETLVFSFESKASLRDAENFSSLSVTGTAVVEGEAETYPIASINYSAQVSAGNPVLNFLQRHGNLVEQHVLLDKAIPLHGNSYLELKIPQSSSVYAKASGDFNPIHVSKPFALLANLPNTIIHGMYTSSAIGCLLETLAVKGNAGAVRSFAASFVGMVLPTDQIDVELWHTAMICGRKVIKVIAKKRETGEVVLKGEAEVEQSRTAYMFTGQGSQEQNMGMDLFANSLVARSVWERADTYYLATYGSSQTSLWPVFN